MVAMAAMTAMISMIAMTAFRPKHAPIPKATDSLTKKWETCSTKIPWSAQAASTAIRMESIIRRGGGALRSSCALAVYKPTPVQKKTYKKKPAARVKNLSKKKKKT
jgi:hypothetical protein